MPNDGGHLILSDEERAELLKRSRARRNIFGRFLRRRNSSTASGAGVSGWRGPRRTRSVPCRRCRRRVECVREHRMNEQTSKPQRTWPAFRLCLAKSGSRQRYLLIPSVSSDNRKYIPIGIHAEDDRCQQPGALRAPRRAISFRRAVLGDAHGMGAAGRREAGTRLPLLRQARLQQLSLAGVAQRESSGRPWKKRRRRCWPSAKST